VGRHSFHMEKELMSWQLHVRALTWEARVPISLHR
jgi:hypothetical protein